MELSPVPLRVLLNDPSVLDTGVHFKTYWLPSVQGSPCILMCKESTLPMLRLYILQQQCFNKNCCRRSILKQNKTGNVLLKKWKERKKEKKKKKKKKRCTSTGQETWYSSCWTAADGKVCLAVDRDLFSVDVPQLVSTEQNTIKKGECE